MASLSKIGPTNKYVHLLFDVYNKKCLHKSSLLSVLCAYWNEYTVLLAFTEKLIVPGSYTQ